MNILNWEATIMIEDMNFLKEQAELLKVIAHPVRLCIVRGLWRNGSCNVTHKIGRAHV